MQAAAHQVRVTREVTASPEGEIGVQGRAALQGGGTGTLQHLCEVVIHSLQAAVRLYSYFDTHLNLFLFYSSV